MGKIIGVSGAQGQGKSTTIQAALTVNDSLNYLDIQTARELLSDWGYTLTEINTFMPLKVKFQEELFKRHEAKLAEALESPGIHLVERTFADIFNYALTSVGPFNEYSEWLNEYANKCAAAQAKYFDHVIFLSGREYTPEEDGVRSTNDHFSKLTDYLIHHYTILFTWDGEENDKVTHINTPDLQGRVDLLNEICEGLDTV